MKHSWVVELLDWSVVSLAAVAAIAGAIGGCGAAGFMILKSKSALKIAQAFAYISIGLVAGIITYLFGSSAGLDISDTTEVIKWAVIMGSTVPIALFAKNVVITAILRKFGWEIQFTIRKEKQERRRTNGNS